MLENAKWIKSPVNEEERCYVFCRDFKTRKGVKKATLTVTAMGLYMAYVNGVRVETGILNPGWTSYDRAVQCKTIDVTEYIKEENELSLVTAEGWAIGYIRAADPFRNHYAENIAVIYSLEIEYGTKRLRESFRIQKQRLKPRILSRLPSITAKQLIKPQR